jgi:hypothetical protein
MSLIQYTEPSTNIIYYASTTDLELITDALTNITHLMSAYILLLQDWA